MKVGVFIGRFQPWHLGHEETLYKALDQCDKVIIMLGSARGPRTVKNPFTVTERISMIDDSSVDTSNIEYMSLRDYPYDNVAWMSDIWCKLNEFVGDGTQIQKVLIGHYKDSSSFYLPMLEKAGLPLLDIGKRRKKINATDIRNDLFTGGTNWHKHVRPNVIDAIEHLETPQQGIIQTLREDYKAIRNFQSPYDDLDYEPTFTATDAVVTYGQNVLLIRRGNAPNKGLLALPGGFLEPGETLLDCMRRELREETGLRVDDYGKVVGTRVFDHPGRDLRGRIVSHAYHVQLQPGNMPPALHAMDDAGAIEWMPYRDCLGREDQFYADHLEIIRYFFSKETA